jgi:hypothetical protein
MIFLATVPSGPSGVRRVRISLPLVPGLLDNERYFLPGDQPPLGEQDRRRLSRPRVDKIGRPSLSAAWRMSHDDRKFIEKRSARHREQRELKELADMLGDPP